ncbi:MAG: peptidoglycan-binding protein [Myxococcales bacterium]|nr:peptidoglycan-binding protein [Myxococcales bacterium]
MAEREVAPPAKTTSPTTGAAALLTEAFGPAMLGQAEELAAAEAGAPGPLDARKLQSAVLYNTLQWVGPGLQALRAKLGLAAAGGADEALAQAAATFQERHALTVDGKVGPATRTAIDEDAAPQATAAPAAAEATVETVETASPTDQPATQDLVPTTAGGAIQAGLDALETVQDTVEAGVLDAAGVEAAIKKDKGVLYGKAHNLNRGLVFAVRDHLRIPIVNRVDEELVRAIAAWQLGHGIAPDGILTDATVSGMEGEGMLTRDPLYWATRDMEDIIAVEAAEQVARDEVEAARAQQSTSGVRQAIVSLAASQIGKINSADRGDGAKYGWERLSHFYAVSCGENDPYVTHPGTRGANLLPGGSKPGEKIGHWSWCGIFAVWAVKSATGVGAWVQGAQGGQEDGYQAMPKSQLFDPVTGAKPGDIMRFSALSHRSVVKEVRPDTREIITVDGNQTNQNVEERLHKEDEVIDWLKTVAD